MIKLRLNGLPDDVEALNQVLRDSDQVIVLDESDDYANRGKSLLVRRYVTVKLKQPATTQDLPPRWKETP